MHEKVSHAHAREHTHTHTHLSTLPTSCTILLHPKPHSSTHTPKPQAATQAHFPVYADTGQTPTYGKTVASEMRDISPSLLHSHTGLGLCPPSLPTTKGLTHHYLHPGQPCRQMSLTPGSDWPPSLPMVHGYLSPPATLTETSKASPKSPRTMSFLSRLGKSWDLR